MTIETAPSRSTSWPVVLAACGAALAVTVGLSLWLGSKPIPFGELAAALSGNGSDYVQSVLASRVLRTIAGAVAGMCLAVSGVMMQGITRNPLGDPGLLGVNIGAAASIVTVTAFVTTTSANDKVWIALPGAFAAMLIVFVIGSGRGGGPVRLVLAGAVITAVLTAYIQAVTLSMPNVFDNYRFWVVGSLAGRTYDTLSAVAPFTIAGVIVAIIMASSLNTLALGDTAAASLGAQTTVIRFGGIVAATLLCASATALAGPIAFVGLAVPHIGRALAGSDHRRQIRVAFLLGPVILIAADIIGRVIARPQELMVGVITAFVGAPFLLVTVRRLRGDA